jgi:hypothetical protein
MLFSGFRERFGDLSAIGAVSLMGNVMLWLVMFALVGDLLTEAVTRPESLSPEQAQELQSRMSVALVIMLALGVPLAMAVWFAPLLVALDGLRTPQALLASLRGILRSALAFTVYTAVLAIVGVAAVFRRRGPRTLASGVDRVRVLAAHAAARDERLCRLSRHVPRDTRSGAGRRCAARRLIARPPGVLRFVTSRRRRPGYRDHAPDPGR